MMIPGFIFEFLPNPPFTSDQMKLLLRDNILTKNDEGLKELGINPSKLEEVLPTIV